MEIVNFGGGKVKTPKPLNRLKKWCGDYVSDASLHAKTNAPLGRGGACVKYHPDVVFSARCNIYISRLCYDVSVRLSVRLSVTAVHWRIIANLGFKFIPHINSIK